MPELPDLELYATNLQKLILGKRIKDIIVFKDNRINVGQKELIQALKNRIFEDITREGKEILFIFSDKITLSIHLMLEGRFEYLETIQEVKNKVIIFALENGYNLIISDKLSWTTLKLNPPSSDVPDALSETFSLDYLKEKISKKKSTLIKSFLLNQEILRGIGNAYADEILWDSKIDPSSKCGKLPTEVIEALYVSIKRVLKNAIQELLEATPSAINGEYRDFLYVHNKNRKLTPSGYKIKVEKIASKKTYYTDEQILYK